jgi:CHAD domain-containing protein
MAAKKKHPWQAGQSSAQNAVEVLPALARAFFAQGKTLTPQVKLEALHDFRIRSKRFRDTLELFRPCYTPRLERLLQSLRDVQQLLGEMNDLTTTRQMLTDRGLAKSQHHVLDILEVRMAEKAEQFFSLWTQTFARQDEERRWVSYLAGGTFNPIRPVRKRHAT